MVKVLNLYNMDKTRDLGIVIDDGENFEIRFFSYCGLDLKEDQEIGIKEMEDHIILYPIKSKK